MKQQGLLAAKKCEGRCSGDYLPLRHHSLCQSSDMVSTVMNGLSRNALECALRCDCSAGETTKF